MIPQEKKNRITDFCILSKPDISKQVCNGSLKGPMQSPAQPKDNLLLSNQYKCAAQHLFHLERNVFFKYFILATKHKEFSTCFSVAVHMCKTAHLHNQMCTSKNRCQRGTCKMEGMKNWHKYFIPC